MSFIVAATYMVAAADTGDDPVLQRALPKLAACYEVTAAAGSEQTVAIAVTVDARGTPTEARVEPASRCMRDVVMTLRWPKAKAAATRSASLRVRAAPEDGPPPGSGYGVSSSSSRRAASGPRVTLGAPRVTGVLEAAIVRRYLKRPIARYAYCYERQLLVSPKLAGTVTLAFAAADDGKVVSATASGLGDDAVEVCMQRAVLKLALPKGPVEGRVDVTLRPR